jgi:hypothetical protein
MMGALRSKGGHVDEQGDREVFEQVSRSQTEGAGSILGLADRTGKNISPAVSRIGQVELEPGIPPQGSAHRRLGRVRDDSAPEPWDSDQKMAFPGLSGKREEALGFRAHAFRGSVFARAEKSGMAPAAFQYSIVEVELDSAVFHAGDQIATE